MQKETVLASTRSLVTVEEIVDELRPMPDAVVLPFWAVSAVAEVPRGSHPSYAHGYSERDNAYYADWDPISRDREEFGRWLDTEVFGGDGEGVALLTDQETEDKAVGQSNEPLSPSR